MISQVCLTNSGRDHVCVQVLGGIEVVSGRQLNEEGSQHDDSGLDSFFFSSDFCGVYGRQVERRG